MNDDNRDSELDALLSPLREPRSTELQVARWKKAASEAARPAARPAFWKMPVAAALVVGFAAGALSVYLALRWNHPAKSEIAETSATMEIIFAKAE